MFLPKRHPPTLIGPGGWMRSEVTWEVTLKIVNVRIRVHRLQEGDDYMNYMGSYFRI